MTRFKLGWRFSGKIRLTNSYSFCGRRNVDRSPPGRWVRIRKDIHSDLLCNSNGSNVRSEEMKLHIYGTWRSTMILAEVNCFNGQPESSTDSKVTNISQWLQQSLAAGVGTLPKSQPCCAYEFDQSLNLHGIVSTRICVEYTVTGWLWRCRGGSSRVSEVEKSAERLLAVGCWGLFTTGDCLPWTLPCGRASWAAYSRVNRGISAKKCQLTAIAHLSCLRTKA